MRNRKGQQRPTSGKCYRCGEPAKGGSFRRCGIETVPFCRGCGTKRERDLYLTRIQAGALSEAAKSLTRRHEIFIAIGLNLGPRISEIVAMKGSNFDWPESRVWITTLKVKGHPEKAVWMGRELVAYLYDLLAGEEGFLFPRQRGGHGWRKGGPISRWTAEKMFHEVSEKAGLPSSLTSHSMRHYFAIRTLEETSDLFFTQKQLRHTSIKSTERYLHLLPGHAIRMADRVPLASVDGEKHEEGKAKSA